MHPDAKKVTPMNRAQIRAVFRSMDEKQERLTPCGKSFQQLMKDLKNA